MSTEALILVETAAITIGIVSGVLIWYLYLKNVTKKINQEKCEHKSWSQYSDGKSTKRYCLDCDKKLEPKN